MNSVVRIVWICGITCNGNTHSFLNHPALEYLLAKIHFIHHPVLPSPLSLQEVVSTLPESDILIFEGAYRPDFERAGMAMEDLFTGLADKTGMIIALGSCASFGGMMKQCRPEEISGIAFDRETPTPLLKRYREKMVVLSGCPIHPEWLAFVLQMAANGTPMPLDTWYRPQALYAYLVHQGCLRGEYFEWKVDAHDFGRKEGCLFYVQGCQGPMTHASCNKILWNTVSSKTRAGMPCIGCTEPTFPKERLFSTQTYMSIPAEMPLGIPKRSYLALAGAAKSFRIKRLEERMMDDHA
ncbi:MAG: hydrogenase [Sulfuricurvum sp.]|uniref:NADH-quinone oxidoreductase subunit B family protein n=1 Tax=Sulfuricurvum sp. TaxID=2025608 RepID=UPI0025DF7892|nr:hydrogenase [Sulfuricurvum sp.]MCK9373734.1 hydrogenase [Sulfuricurvum sp.]